MVATAVGTQRNDSDRPFPPAVGTERLTRAAARQRGARLRALHDASLAVATPDPARPDTTALLLVQMTERAAQVLGGVTSWITLIDDPVWSALAPAGDLDGDPFGGYVMLEHTGRRHRASLRPDGATFRAIVTGELVWVSDTTDAGHAGAYDGYVRQGIHSLALVPLRTEGRVLGALGISFPRPGTLQEDDRESLELFAAHAAAAVDRVRLIQAERQRTVQAQKLAATLALLGAATHLDEAAEALLRGAVDLLGGVDGVVRTFDQETGVCTTQLQLQSDGTLVKQMEPRRLRPGSFGALLQAGGLANVCADYLLLDPAQYPHYEAVKAGGLRSGVNVPINAGGQRIGSLHVSHTRPGFFGAPDLSTAEALAAYAGTAIERAQLDEARQEAERRRNEAVEALAQQADALRESEARFRRLAENAPDMLYRYELSPVRGFSYVSPASTKLLGYSPEELCHDGDIYGRLVHPEDRAAIRGMLTGTGPSEVMARFFHRTGETVWLDVRFSVLHDSQGQVIGAEGIARDVTVQKTLEHQLAHQAFHDPLTNLPNRALFLDQLVRALARSQRRQESTAVLFLDLDRFKVVNDSLGHDAGDRLLREVASRIQRCIRPGDTVARLGGDEFTLLLDNVAGCEGAAVVADRVISVLQAPFRIAGQDVVISCSVGIAMAPPSRAGDDARALADALLRDADSAMYQAKSKGRSRYEVFQPGLHAEALARLALEADLRQALERDELRVYYQPKLLLETTGVVEMEALVRWQHPQQGLKYPAEFIPMAEETGLIIPLGHYVLREACQQAQRWHQQYPQRAPIRICVNLSAREFQQAHLEETVAAVLAETGLAPEYLELEITESVIMEDMAAAATTLKALKALGVRLAIDDFGTGYSSLSYLRRFPVDCIKIDQSFVAGLGQDVRDTAIVSTLVQLAHGLGLRVTAEGVETEDQLGHLRQMECDFAQGFLFARALEAGEASVLLSQPE